MYDIYINNYIYIYIYIYNTHCMYNLYEYYGACLCVFLFVLLLCITYSIPASAISDL